MTLLGIARAHLDAAVSRHLDVRIVQRVRLRRLVRFVVRHSAFYRELYAEIDVEGDDWTLQDLPTVDKPTLMANWDRAVTDPALRRADVLRYLQQPGAHGLYRGRHVVVETSGTSGAPGLFVYSTRAWEQTLGILLDRQPSGGPRPWRQKMAYLGMVGDHYGGWLLARSFPAPFVRVEPIAVTRPFDAWIRELQAFQPEIVAGYVSAVHLAAREQMAGRLRIRPRRVTMSGEPVTEAARRDVEAAWGVTPTNHYACVESLALAMQCRQHRSLHVNEDWHALEVERDGVLLTNLYNDALPIIRYRVGDVVIPDAAPCPCGTRFTSIARVDGRAEDILWLEGEGGRSEPLVPQMFAALFADGLKSWQVVQEGPRTLRFVAVPAAGEADRVVGEVRQYVEGLLREKGLAGIRTRIEVVEAIPPEPHTGKHRQVVRAVQTTSTRDE